MSLRHSKDERSIYRRTRARSKNVALTGKTRDYLSHGSSEENMSDRFEKQVIKDLTTRRRPRVLYHYTSGLGLLGIASSQSIWATNIRYLNDSTEYNLAIQLARTVVEKDLASSRGKFDTALNTVLQERIVSQSTDVYVTSFTENEDQLSQWRAYCPPGQGYAIGFSTKALVPRPVSAQDRFLVPCIYDPDQQTDLMRNVVTIVLDFADENRKSGLPHDRVLREAFKLLGRLLPMVAPALKDPGFAEEEEWRLVHLPTAFEGVSPEFRQGRSMLIPYHRIIFGGGSGELPIEHIVIGPTPNAELARDAVQALFRARATRASVVPSAIPYRSW